MSLPEKLAAAVRRSIRARRRLRERLEEVERSKVWRREVSARVCDPDSDVDTNLLVQAEGRLKEARAAVELTREALAEADAGCFLALCSELGVDPNGDDARVADAMAVTLRFVRGGRR